MQEPALQERQIDAIDVFPAEHAHTDLQPGQVLQLNAGIYYVRKVTKKDVVIRRIRRDQMHRLHEVVPQEGE